MTGHSPASDHLWLLLDAACDGRLEETQLDELATFLESDAESRSLFADHVQLRTDIRLLCMADRSSEAGLARVAGRLRDSAEGREARTDETGCPVASPHRSASDSSFRLHPSSFRLAQRQRGVALTRLPCSSWRRPAWPPGHGGRRPPAEAIRPGCSRPPSSWPGNRRSRPAPLEGGGRRQDYQDCAG